MTALIVTTEDVDRMRDLVALALEHPVPIQTLEAKLADEDGRREHIAQMQRQTIAIATPAPDLFYTVILSIEDGHTGGRCRHMSVGINRDGYMPSPPAVQILATLMGFYGELQKDTVSYIERCSDGVLAINILQLMAPKVVH